MDIEYYDFLMASLENFKMLKIAHLEGIDVSDAPSPYTDPYWDDSRWDIFFYVLEKTFEIVEVYSGDEAEQRYWLSSIGMKNEREWEGMVIVIMDDSILSPSLPKPKLENHAEWFGYVEIEFIERGIVLYIDETEGLVDLVAILSTILQIKKS